MKKDGRRGVGRRNLPGCWYRLQCDVGSRERSWRTARPASVC